MNLFGVSDIVTGIGRIFDELHTSEDEKLQARLQEKAIDASLLLGQQQTNLEEAKHPSRFVAGWRPMIGWVCASGLAYQFILHPLLTWGWSILIGLGYIQERFEAPPPLAIDVLMSLVMALLGVGSMRSYDKSQKTDTKEIRE